MLLCRFRRWLSPFAPRSSVCRPRRLSSIFPSPPVADMGKSVARGGSSEAKPKEKPSPVSSHKDEAYLDAVIQKRVHLFETIQVQQKAERLNLDGESIKYVFCPLSLRVTLPDGTIKEGKKWLTSPMDIAKEISSGLAAKGRKTKEEHEALGRRRKWKEEEKGRIENKKEEDDEEEEEKRRKRNRWWRMMGGSGRM
ncbi:hypothetical protein BHM03_00037589 [Ensete ventricosum]|nr:hypothetical protein BHM03_00037589 [Ensete ventricosum]